MSMHVFCKLLKTGLARVFWSRGILGSYCFKRDFKCRLWESYAVIFPSVLLTLSVRTFHCSSLSSPSVFA